MNSFQRIIKYVAIALAMLLAVVIVGGIANVGYAIISAVPGETHTSKNKLVDFTDTFTEVKSLDINISTGKLSIRTGDEFKVEAEDVNKGFIAEVVNDGTLKISEDNNNFNFLWFNFNGYSNPNSKITLYLPDEYIAEEVLIDSGAGSISIDGIHSNYLEVSAGAGAINGRNVSAEEVKIDGGVGSVTLKNVKFKDTDFNCGVGSVNVDGILLGDNRIDCGVGSVNLDLAGDLNEYDLNIDSGVGTVRVNGEKISNEYRSDKNAPNNITVDGGVGEVRINIGH